MNALTLPHSQHRLWVTLDLSVVPEREPIMRDLTEAELTQVSGAGKCCGCKPDRDEGKGNKGKKGNNGYGNGGDDGVPGRSGKQDYTR